MKLLITCILINTILLFLSACSLQKINQQVELIENRSVISGTVNVEGDNKNIVYVGLLEQRGKHITLINKKTLNTNGSYQFDVLPGKYLVTAFIDENSNQKYEHGESSVYYGHQKKRLNFVDIHKAQHYKLPVLTIQSQIDPIYFEEYQEKLSKITKNIGKIVTLNDPMFAAENGSIGLWQPFDFVHNIGGGLLMLQEYDNTKTPVIFVHGILSTPLEFKTIINKLDRDKFQPWLLYYPSGLPLDIVSNYFLNALNQLHDQYKFSDIQIISHSMGGLMSRSFIMKQQVNPAFDISLFVTINSPLYGMDSASSGVEYSPIVIPVWRDISSNSDFIKRVHKWKIPAKIPYHLVFSYLKNEDGDGVVPLSSQLSQSLQNEAIKIYGFNAQHAEILKNPDFIARLNKILANPELKNTEK